MNMDESIEEVSEKVIRDCLRLDEGDQLVIGAYNLTQSELEFLSILGKECNKIGAVPAIVVRPDSYVKKSVKEVKKEYLMNEPSHLVELFRNSDAHLGLTIWAGKGGVEVDTDKKRAFDTRMQKIREPIVENELKTINLYIPSRSFARESDHSYEELLGMMLKAINIDYQELSKRSELIKDKLEKGDTIKIVTSKGTDISFEIDERKVGIEDGRLTEEKLEEGTHFGELPTGEVFTTPIEDSVEGTAFFEKPTESDELRGLKLKFEDGKITEYEVKEGKIFFEDKVENATGDKKKIGEFAIGTNPNVEFDFPILKEKARGTIHLALGNNTHLGGENESSLHWDLVMNEPTVYVDDEMLLEEGELAIE